MESKAQSCVDPFCKLFLIYGLNKSKFEQFKKSYEIVCSYPDLLDEKCK